MVAYTYEWGLVRDALPTLAHGILFTLKVTGLSTALALGGGLVIALARLSRWRLVRIVGYGYVQIFRSMSIYIYILWTYFGLPIILHVNLSALQAGVLSLALLNSAYMAEIYRSALTSVDIGQREAANSLGLHPSWVFCGVILPQAVRIAIPPLGNQFIDIIKDSSLVALIGASDLMYVTVKEVTATGHAFEFYTTTAGIYLGLVIVASRLVARSERVLGRHIR